MTDPTKIGDIGGIEGEKGHPGKSGVAVATVTDNEDPEKLGRVKLTYPWRDSDDDSYWARVTTPMGGSGYGAYFLPEVGDEVLVAFQDGDIRHPFVVGSLWTGKKKPPENNADGNNDIRAIQSRKGHRVEFDDAKQGSKMTIETDAGHTIKLDDKSGSEKITIEGKSGSNSIELDSVAGEISLTGQTKISLSAPTIELSAESEVNVSSEGKVNVEGKGETNLKGSGKVKIESSGLMEVKSGAILKMQGAMIKLN